MRRALACAFLLTLLTAPAARAADPITPLSDVHRGMTCTARTVVQGTTISDFDVEVLDVVAEGDGSGARILVRVSGPAVAGTGIASGFSGSPVYCANAQGVVGNAGAISATIGQYGNDVGLVTPIEQMLAMPVKPPSGVRRAPQLLRSARPLATPLTITGLSPKLGSLLERVARRHDRTLVAAPAGPLGTFAPQPLVPGASMAVSISSGAVNASGIGTVTYRDGDTVYGFGHGFEDAGRRALLLQDAYVYTVVGNPLDIAEMTSYKLAAPGHVLGTLTNDGPDAVVGTLAEQVRTVPLTVRVRDRDLDRTLVERTELVDEIDLGDPDGQGYLSGIAAVAVAQAVTEVFNGAPAQQTGRMCLTAHLREARRPLRFCNRYVVAGGLDEWSPGPIALSMGNDVTVALDGIADARFKALHLTRIEATATVERGLRLATIRSARAPRTVRPGQRVDVALRVRLYRGPLRTIRFKLRIPRDAPSGPRTLKLTGTSLEGAGGGEEDVLDILLDLFGLGGGGRAWSLRQVVDRFEATARYDGVRAQLGGDRWRVYRDERLRIDGRTQLDFIVAGTRRGEDELPPELQRLLDRLG